MIIYRCDRCLKDQQTPLFRVEYPNLLRYYRTTAEEVPGTHKDICRDCLASVTDFLKEQPVVFPQAEPDSLNAPDPTTTTVPDEDIPF